MKLRKILPLMALLSLSVSNSFAAQFIDVTSDTYNKIWSVGQAYKSNRKLENPVNYGVELRSGAGGAAVLVTPGTIVKYIAYSKDERLIFPGEAFKSAVVNSTDYVYIATYAMHLKNPIAGTVAQQVPSQRLLIEKDGKYIMPEQMSPVIYDAMPHSYAVVYYAFPKNVVLNAPYTIKFINGNGDKIEIPITAEKLADIIDKENKLVYKPD